MLAKLSIVAVVFVLASCGDVYPPMRCQFERMSGTYEVAGDELAKQNNHIIRPPLIMATRDSRTFMFRSDQLMTCEDQQ